MHFGARRRVFIMHSEIVMRTGIVMICIMWVILNGNHIYAQSIAAAMGDNFSVVPSGAADVARNPALLAMEQRKMEFLGYAGFLLYSLHDPSLDAEIALPPLKVEKGPFVMYNPEKQMLEGGGAFFMKSGNIAFGVAIQGNVKKEHTSFDLNMSLPALSTEILFRNEETQNGSSTTGYTTFSYRVNNNLSLGLQYKLEYKAYLDESENTGFTNAAPSSWEYEMSTETSFISTGILGVLISIEPINVGLIFLSPDYSYKKNKYRNKKDDYDNPANSYSLSDSSPDQQVITNSMGMMLGIGVHVTSDLTLAGEFGFRMNGSYNETILIVNNKTYEEIDQKNSYDKLFLFSIGMKYVIDHGLTVACGSFGRSIVMENHYDGTSKNGRVEIKYMILGLRFGFDKRISSFVSLVIVGSIERTVIDVTAQTTENAMRMKFDEKNTENSFSASAAVRILL